MDGAWDFEEQVSSCGVLASVLGSLSFCKEIILL